MTWEFVVGFGTAFTVAVAWRRPLREKFALGCLGCAGTMAALMLVGAPWQIVLGLAVTGVTCSEMSAWCGRRE